MLKSREDEGADEAGDGSVESLSGSVQKGSKTDKTICLRQRNLLEIGLRYAVCQAGERSEDAKTSQGARDRTEKTGVVFYGADFIFRKKISRRAQRNELFVVCDESRNLPTDI